MNRYINIPMFKEYDQYSYSISKYLTIICGTHVHHIVSIIPKTITKFQADIINDLNKTKSDEMERNVLPKYCIDNDGYPCRYIIDINSHSKNCANNT